jgi:YVTN family beta-propeller protein
MTMHMLLFRSDKMLMKVLLTAALPVLLLSGCALPASTHKPALEDEGEVDLYIQPFPQDAEKLKFTIDRISLVGSDGREFPLSPALTDFQAGGLQRQRFLAAGRVPPGKFSGLSLKVVKAALSGAEGDSALQVPDEPVLVPLSFEVRRRKVLVLCLEFQYAGSVQKGSFAPRFSLYVPSLPVSGLLGYVVNRADNTLTIFDKKTGQVAAIRATGRGPEQVVFDPTSRIAYLSLAGEDAVDVLDLADGEVTHRINLKTGDRPGNIALTPDGKTLLAVNARSNTLSIIDPVALVERSRVQLSTIDPFAPVERSRGLVGEGPRWLLVGRNGTRCYVFNGLSKTITVIDIANSAVVTTISTDADPFMGQFNRKGDRLYVVHEGSPYLLVIDTASFSIVKRVFLGYGISAIKVDSASDTLYVSRKGDSRIEVYEPFSLTLIDYLPAIKDVLLMTIDGEANNLFLLNAGQRRLLSISLVSRKTVTETDIGDDPSWVTMMGER